MFASYSASKRRNFNPVPDSFQSQAYSRKNELNQGDQIYGSYDPKISHRRSSSSGLKQHQPEQNKENVNASQIYYEKNITPTKSPLKQFSYSPMKLTNVFDSLNRKKSNVKADLYRGQVYGLLQSCQIQTTRQTRGLNTSYGQNKLYRKYQQKSPLKFQNQPQLYKCESAQLSNSRIATQRTVTVSGSSGPYMSGTPQKAVVQVDQLVEKTEFLKQRLQRLNRMTPIKNQKKEQFHKEQITPQKICPEPRQLNINVVKYNKYCHEKLPLQTISDSQQHKLQLKSHIQVEEAEQGIEKINNLSKKISQRLKNIINRHNK